MEKQTPTFENFLNDVNPVNRPFVEGLHAWLLENGCTVKLELAKSGYVVSYAHAATKRVLANYVFRKQGVVIRIYADNVDKYEAFLQTMPEAMQKKAIKAPVCRRMLDPTKCNARCPMGYVFTLGGELQKKCRYNSFMFLLDAESNPFIQTFVENELRARSV